MSMLPRVQDEGAISQTIMWLPSAGISLSFYLDGLALLFSLIITGIGALIFFYAGFYFDDAAEHNRFIIWLSAFAGAMLALVLSGNVLMMFIAWELTSITSFILIGFKGADGRGRPRGRFQSALRHRRRRPGADCWAGHAERRGGPDICIRMKRFALSATSLRFCRRRRCINMNGTCFRAADSAGRIHQERAVSLSTSGCRAR